MQIPKECHTLIIKVIPRAKKTEYIGLMDDGSLKIRLRAIPEDDKANKELLHFLEENTGEKWEIISGSTSARKMIRKVG